MGRYPCWRSVIGTALVSDSPWNCGGIRHTTTVQALPYHLDAILENALRVPVQVHDALDKLVLVLALDGARDQGHHLRCFPHGERALTASTWMSPHVPASGSRPACRPWR